MARVYRAEHEALQRQVALKVLLDPSGSADGHERFLREARIAAAIKHPNVVNIFDVGVDGSTPYLVMELLEGVDLDAFMAGKPRLDEATTMDIIVPIAGALAAVHEAGIVHRDLKPGNIFLARGRNDEIEPRLLDFGISKSVGDQLKLTYAQGPVMGTPYYMSPEAAAGGEMTPLSDQYALGVVLYECVTGVNPFAGASSFPEVVHRVTLGDCKPVALQNPQLSRRLAAIIERAMQVDPARRFADMRAMGRELLMLAGQRTRITWGLSFNNLPSGGPPRMLAEEGPVFELARPKRRRRYLVPVAAAAMLLSGALLVGKPMSGGGTSASAAKLEASAGTSPLFWALKPEAVALDDASLQLPDRVAAAGLDVAAAGRASGGENAAPSREPAGVLPVSDPPSTSASEAAVVTVTEALRTSPAARPRPSASSGKGRSASRKGTRPANSDSTLVFGTNNAPILD
jgi:eukaryotic-like serine/threonine-protein kinase